jgi:peptidoglycan/xylan/chitin deacetylase (PgdA/CDA1 family)
MLRVLTYHRIAKSADTPHLDPALVSATPDVFRKQMLHLKEHYRPVPLDDVVHAFRHGGALPDRAVHVTFDDAYRDFGEIAWPVLRELEIPATVFVPTAYPGDPDRAFWWDRLHRAESHASPSAWADLLPRGEYAVGPNGVHADLRTSLRLLPHDETEQWIASTCEVVGLNDPSAGSGSPVLSWDELRELRSQGVSIGAHTRNHVALSRVDPDRARSEIRQALDDLSRELGEARWTIAYPYGMYDDTVAEVAADEGCVLGFTCDDGLNPPGETDPMRVHRTNITLRTTPTVFAIRMQPWFAAIDRWRHRHERGRSNR